MRPLEAKASIASPYNLQMGYGLPLSETTTADNMALLAMYSSPVMDSLPPKTPLKSDSGLTHNINIPLISRKRSRDPSSQILPYAVPVQQRDKSCGTNFSFFGEDISLKIEQQQLDINRLIAQHVSVSSSSFFFFSLSLAINM